VFVVTRGLIRLGVRSFFESVDQISEKLRNPRFSNSYPSGRSVPDQESYEHGTPPIRSAAGIPLAPDGIRGIYNLLGHNVSLTATLYRISRQARKGGPAPWHKNSCLGWRGGGIEPIDTVVAAA